MLCPLRVCSGDSRYLLAISWLLSPLPGIFAWQHRKTLLEGDEGSAFSVLSFVLPLTFKFLLHLASFSQFFFSSRRIRHLLILIYSTRGTAPSSLCIAPEWILGSGVPIFIFLLLEVRQILCPKLFSVLYPWQFIFVVLTTGVTVGRPSRTEPWLLPNFQLQPAGWWTMKPVGLHLSLVPLEWEGV